MATIEVPTSGDIAVTRIPEVRIYSHSPFVYWWPLWALGYAFAAVIYFGGTTVTLDGAQAPAMFHGNKNLGVIYTLALFLVIVITNVTFRGLSSFTLILAVAFFVLLIAYFGWWDDIARWMPYLSVHMNLGFYLLFSTLLFAAWMLTFFVYDRLAYWRVQPAQVTYEHLIGGAEKTYDTEGMVVEKLRDDVFRHWILGVGSGDIHLVTNSGHRHEEHRIGNVLFVDRKVAALQRLIAIKPDQLHSGIVAPSAVEV